MEFNELLSIMIEKEASDLHIKAGRPPIYRIHGKMVPLECPSFTE